MSGIATVVETQSGDRARDDQGRFVRGEGDFQGPPKFANAPVTYEGEFGKADETPVTAAPTAPQTRQAPQIDEDTRIALQALPAGEVPSEHSPIYQRQAEAQAPEPIPAPVAPPAPSSTPDQTTQLLVQLLQQMVQNDAARLNPPIQPSPPRPSELQRFVEDPAFQAQKVWEVSAGKLDPRIPEHVAMAYQAMATAERLESEKEERTRQYEEMRQFRDSLTQTAQLQNAKTVAHQALSSVLKDYSLSDDAAAMTQLVEQAAPWIAQGHEPSKVVQQFLAPVAKHLTRKASTGQPGRMAQPTQAQQGAMRQVASGTKATGRPGDRGPKMTSEQAMAVLARAERHLPNED